MKVISIEVAPEHAYGREFLRGIASFAARRGNAQLQSVSQTTPTGVIVRSSDGIIMRLFGNRIGRAALRHAIPTVDIYGERPRPGIAEVHGDYTAIGNLAADFFLRRRYENFAWCGIAGVVFSDRIRDAFVSRLRDAGKSVYEYDTPQKPQRIINSFAPDQIPDAKQLTHWLKTLPRPSALFCCNDHRAYQVMHVATAAKIRIPTELAILGVDNDPMICAFARTPISSIEPDAYRIGYTAARVLDAMLKAPPHVKSHNPVLIPPKCIIERESTQHIPIEPPWLAKALLVVEARLSEGVSAADVCAATGMSVPTVERAFREKLHTSVIGFINDRRMEKAKSLLKTSNLLTKEIAAACGFSSAQYFCRLFSARYGKSPQAMRGNQTSIRQDATGR